MIRPSSLHIADNCSGFISLEMAEGPAITYQGDRSAALEGSAAHLLTADWLRGIETTPEEASAKFKIHGLDMEAWVLGWMAERAVSVFQMLSDFFPNPVIEARIDGPFPGTPDVYALDPDNKRVAILDHKFGRVRRPCNEKQLLGYAADLMEAHDWAETAYLVTSYPRLNEDGEFGAFDAGLYTREQVAQFVDHMENMVMQAKKRPVFALGDHCTFCKHAVICPAVNAALKQLPEAMDTPEAIQEGRRVRAAVKPWVERFEAAQKALLSQGDYKLPSGKVLYLREQDRVSVAKDSLGWLTQKLPPEKLLECATFSKGKVVDLIVKGAPRGTKKQAMDDLQREGLAAGAFEKKVIQIVEEK